MVMTDLLQVLLLAPPVASLHAYAQSRRLCKAQMIGSTRSHALLPVVMRPPARARAQVHSGVAGPQDGRKRYYWWRPRLHRHLLRASKGSNGRAPLCATATTCVCSETADGDA